MELQLAPTTHARDDRLFRIFLQDHLAALHATAAMLHRTLKENRDGPVGRILAPMHVATREDVLHLEQVARAQGVKPSRLKNVGARFAEKLGRLKPNGRIIRYSPLSRVLELEGLLMLTVQRSALWRILEVRAALDPRVRHAGVELELRADLAERQALAIERMLIREGGYSL